MTIDISRTGLCTVGIIDNVMVLSASFGHPLSMHTEVEIAEASSIRIEKNGKGEIVRIFISGIAPKEAK